MDTNDAGENLVVQESVGTNPLGEVVAKPLGDENEAPVGEYQSDEQAAAEIEYAHAVVRYRAAKAEWTAARAALVSAVHRVGSDEESALDERLRSPKNTYDIPLPMSFAAIREFTGWSTPQVNDFLKYRIGKGSIKKRGKRGHYIYYYPGDKWGEKRNAARNLRQEMGQAVDDGDHGGMAVPTEQGPGFTEGRATGD